MQPSSTTTDLIRTLNENDVLLGRGQRPFFSGNVAFRELVDTRKNSYTALSAVRKDKDRIGRQVMNEIHARGGRFLCLAGIEPDDSGTSVELWKQVTEKVALDKVKMALRQKKQHGQRRKEANRGSDTSTNERETGETSPSVSTEECVSEARVSSSNSLFSSGGEDVPFAALLTETFERTELGENIPLAADLTDTFDCTESSDVHPTRMSLSPVLPSTLLGTLNPAIGAAVAAVDATLNIFQQSQLAFQQQLAATSNNDSNKQSATATRPLYFLADSALRYCRPDTNSDDDDDSQDAAKKAGSKPGSNIFQRCFIDNNAAQSMKRSASRDVPMEDEAVPESVEDIGLTAADADISELLLSGLGYTDEMKPFTEEMEAKEWASLTDEERAAAMNDIFGRLCLEGRHQSKRARKDLDEPSTTFLIKQMKDEIERMPDYKKEALVEARTKCGREEEFSDERLAQFLRADGWNSKLGAQRFVNYWASRRELFGETKYTMRMTLSEALRDDIPALESGVFHLLPHSDLSGRKILYVAPFRHTKDGYDTDSLIRVCWYFMEIIADEYSYSNLILDKFTTIFDIDAKLNRQTTYLYLHCWPVKAMGTHIVSQPKILMRLFKPILLALLSKEERSRLKFHDIPDCDVVETLAGYGMLQHMLPKEMGGSVELNIREWILNRRAIELEEL